MPRKRNLDPDVRFLLANERTLLAWIRTSLAVVAGGIALTQLGHNSTVHVIVGTSAILIGIFMLCIGYLRFKEADRAIRANELPVSSTKTYLLAAGAATVGLAIVTVFVYSW